MDPTTFYRLFRQAVQACQLYPADSPVPQEASARLAEALVRSTPAEGHSLSFLETGVYANGTPMGGEGDDAAAPFGRRLFELGLGEIRFLPGITPAEVRRLVDLLSRALQGLLNPVDEDLSVLLWESELSHVAYWLYEAEDWLEEEFAQPVTAEDWATWGVPPEEDEDGAPDQAVFLSAADQVLNISPGESIRGGDSGRRPGASDRYRGLPISDYVDGDFEVLTSIDARWAARLTEEERLAILSAHRQELSETIPWKYGRLLTEVLRLEAGSDEIAKIRGLLRDYLDALAETRRFALFLEIFGALRPNESESARATQALLEVEQAAWGPDLARHAATHLAAEGANSLPDPDACAAREILSKHPVRVLSQLHVPGTAAARAIQEALESNMRRDPAAVLDCLATDRRDLKLLALERVGPGTNDVTRRVRELSRDPDPELRSAAVRALGRFNDGATIAALAAALQDPSAEIRRLAATSLATIGGPAALEPLLRVMVSKEFDQRGVEERRHLLVAAGKTAPREVLPVLARLAEQRVVFPWQPAGARARVAFEALGELGGLARSYLRQRWEKRRGLLAQFEDQAGDREHPSEDETRRAA